jgi:hypothetical protein
MKCMVHTQEGMRRGEMPDQWSAPDAVAVCSICGMGLCPAHLLEREVNITGRVSGWASETSMVVLCERCATAGDVTG